jgi:CRISPR-associated protein Csx3
MYYSANLGASRTDGFTVVEINFGERAENDRIVPAAIQAIEDLNLTGGPGILFHGPASLPVAMALAHAVAHLYGFVAAYDPKLSRYVVSISHTPGIRPGDLLS